MYMDTTSGTTGIPLEFYRTWPERGYMIAKYLRALFLNGLKFCPNITFALIGGAILVGIVVSLFLIFKYKKVENFAYELFDRIATVSYLYLLLDLIGIGIVIYRNIVGAAA